MTSSTAGQTVNGCTELAPGHLLFEHDASRASSEQRSGLEPRAATDAEIAAFASVLDRCVANMRLGS